MCFAFDGRGDIIAHFTKKMMRVSIDKFSVIRYNASINKERGAHRVPAETRHLQPKEYSPMATKAHSTTKSAPSNIPAEGKYTCYNRETMDYDGYFDGRYLGSRDNMNAARDLVNEYVYDLERSGELFTATELDSGAVADEMEVKTYTSDGDASVIYTDFTIGADLTKVTIGTLGREKFGVELIIGGTCLNECLNEVITLADVRVLRDNLDTLLNDPRVQAMRKA